MVHNTYRNTSVIEIESGSGTSSIIIDSNSVDSESLDLIESLSSCTDYTPSLGDNELR